MEHQHKIGWQRFSEGLIPESWLDYQLLQYFKENGSRQSAQLWVSKVIQEIWTFTFGIWETRNKALHNTDKIKELEGQGNLVERAIVREWNTGLGQLQASEYLLGGSLAKLIESSLLALQRWLAIVRNERIFLDKNNINYDEFYTDGALRKWVGIVKIRDGKPIIE